MNAAASITTDDGDKVNHGWSQLDIAKHSTNTFVSSLQDGDYFSVVTYSDAAKARALIRLALPCTPFTSGPIRCMLLFAPKLRSADAHQLRGGHEALA